ncbi:MAG: hypothetical protein HRT80_11825 [Henriciella sp.]|nr:hypothetical protein [Henriciella sp.]
MASVCISIENETVLTRFHRALNQAGSIASDMIEVKTMIDDGCVLKIVRTECPWAIAVFRSIGKSGSRS